MTLEIIPTGAVVGAELRGVDLSQPLGDNVFAEIEHAYDEHGVIFFRTQDITPEQQVAFTRRFGEIEFNIFGERWSVPGCPEIVVVSNITEDGKPIGVRRAGENWHSDMCYAPRPPRGTMLYAREIPTLHGVPLGDTEFASAAAAWDALPDVLKARIDRLQATFDFAGRNRAIPPLLKSEWVEMGDQPLLAVERTVERVRGRWPLSSPCRRRRWPEGQALQGPSVLG